MIPRTSPEGRLALVILLAAVYAACYTAIKAGLAFAPPLRFAGLRAAIAGLVLLGALATLRRPLLPPRRLWPWIFALSVTGTVLAYGAMFSSPGRTGAGIASVLGNTGPLIVVVLAVLFLGEEMTRGKTVALVLGLVGVSLISYPALAGPSRFGLSGAVLALAAATGTAGESILFKAADAGDALVRVAGWQFLIGSVPLLALSAWLEGGAGIEWNGRFMLLLIFLALIGTAGAVSLWYWLIQRDEVGRLSLLLFMVPVLGLGLAVAVFRERIGPHQAVGIAVTLAGLAVLAREAWVNRAVEADRALADDRDEGVRVGLKTSSRSGASGSTLDPAASPRHE
ncbi:MAG: EamA family transporter [Gemmatimonadetes bacterium]|nr:EamA family transporter [Gemmatimonadota bacterium]